MSTQSLKNKRLMGEYRKVIENPIGDYCTIAVKPEDLTVWYFLFRVDEGEFIFKIKHSENYPLEPPSLYSLTPNGVFNTNTRICTTFSDFHKNDWDPVLTTEKIIIGLMSYYHSAKAEEDGMKGIGVNIQSEEKRKKLAQESVLYNKIKLQKDIRDLFYDKE